jgi:hypothetical protein
MSGQTGGTDDNPYVFTEQIGRRNMGDPEMINFKNPAAAFFDGMADFVRVMKTRPAMTQTGTSTYIMGQSQGEFKEDTAGPNPGLAIAAREAQARSSMIIPTQTEEYNTLVSIIMDRSVGMDNVAGTFNGQTLLLWDLGRALAAIAVEQCRATKSHFCLFSYSWTGYVDWPGPSQDYDGAIEFLLGSNSQAFVPEVRSLNGEVAAGHEPGSGCQTACDYMFSGFDLEGNSLNIDRAVSIVFSNQCYNWPMQHWDSLEFNNNVPLDQYMRTKGPVYYVGVSPSGGGREDQIIPYFGGVMRNTGGGRTTQQDPLYNDYQPRRYEDAEHRLPYDPMGRAGEWVYFPGTMRLAAEVCWSRANGINITTERSHDDGNELPATWPHEGVDMESFFKCVMLAPDRADGMITLAGTFADLVCMTHPDGDYE